MGAARIRKLNNPETYGKACYSLAVGDIQTSQIREETSILSVSSLSNQGIVDMGVYYPFEVFDCQGRTMFCGVAYPSFHSFDRLLDGEIQALTSTQIDVGLAVLDLPNYVKTSAQKVAPIFEKVESSEGEPRRAPTARPCATTPCCISTRHREAIRRNAMSIFEPFDQRPLRQRVMFQRHCYGLFSVVEVTRCNALGTAQECSGMVFSQLSPLRSDRFVRWS